MLLKYLYLFYGLTFGVSGDCPNVIRLALGMQVDVWKTALMNQLRSDCCISSLNTYDGIGKFTPKRLYIVCSTTGGIQHVTEINWYGMSLVGYIDETAIPSTVTALNLFGNDLTGSLPRNLPPGLAEISVSGNSLSGDLPVFPSTMVRLFLEYTGFTGNHFTGVLILNRPVKVYIKDNWITDIIISDAGLLVECDLSNNPLLGNPRLSSLAICEKDDLYSADTLPKTISTTQSRTTFKTIVKTASTTAPRISFFTVSSGTTSGISTASSIATGITSSTRKMGLGGITTGTISLTSDTLQIFGLPNSEIYSTQMGSTVSYEYFTSTSTSFAPYQNDQPNSSEAQTDAISSLLVYGAMGGLGLLCTLVVLASFVFKNPQMRSKYGRKNSYGTLNTVTTKT